MDYQKVLNSIYKQIIYKGNKGELPTYIPELVNVNPQKFGAFLLTIDNKKIGVGDYCEKFSIQSIAKVLSLSFAYSLFKEKIWKRVGVEPSGTPFNSLVQLESDQGIPRNPFINAGALVICDMLVSEFKNPKKEFLNFIKNISGNKSLHFSKNIVNSEKNVGFRNIALCNFIKSFNNIKNEPNKVLDFYFNMCSIEMTCQELSETFYFLANHGVTLNGQRILSVSQSKRVNAVMQTCGFYDESGEFTFKVGLPGKSGVGGGIIAVHPGKYIVSTWSPKLNSKGNSYRGMKFLEQLTTKTNLSVF